MHICNAHTKPWAMLSIYHRREPTAAPPTYRQLCALLRYLTRYTLDRPSLDPAVTGGACVRAMAAELSDVTRALRGVAPPPWPLCVTECSEKDAAGTWDATFWGFTIV